MTVNKLPETADERQCTQIQSINILYFLLTGIRKLIS